LTEAQHLAYHQAVCQSLGLNPLSKPFECLTLDGKLRLYALRDCADPLRRLHGTDMPDVPEGERTTRLTPDQAGELKKLAQTGSDYSTPSMPPPTSRDSRNDRRSCGYTVSGLSSMWKKAGNYPGAQSRTCRQPPG
jgi:hypothetical protein